ncbi:MAG: uracil-DNA glycosylase [Gammaproteobacteria bacterium]|nr:uracil-DNA glycosylase [Gammaproteobacteria bacterium]
MPTLEASWQAVLSDEFAQPYMQSLSSFLDSEMAAGKSILPAKNEWFNALNSTPLNKVKVVILGQDPYPTLGHGHGLCFSVQPHVKPLPKSLCNINKELLSDCQIDNQHTGFLRPWSQQGVLLLNAVLTVEEGCANAHQNKGWEAFTDKIIETINKQNRHCVFILWGSYAQKKGRMIHRDKHLVLEAPHPSPLSAYRGFWGSQPFSKTNDYLSQQGRQPINWQLPKNAESPSSEIGQTLSLF